MNAEIEELVAGDRRFVVLQAEALDVVRQIPIGSVGALITDPPYSSGGFTRGDRTADPAAKYRRSDAKENTESFSGDNRDQRAYFAWVAHWLSLLNDGLATGAPVCLFTDWRQLPITVDAFQAGGMIWRGIVPWTKGDRTRPQLGRFRNDSEFIVWGNGPIPTEEAEFMIWGSAGPMPANPAIGVLAGSFDIPPVHDSVRLHLTEKPLELMERIVSIAPVGSLVVDLFCGSGTTGIAALRRGCRFLGVDRSKHYADMARDRCAAEVESSTLEARRAGQLSLLGGT